MLSVCNFGEVMQNIFTSYTAGKLFPSKSLLHGLHDHGFLVLIFT
jgi:hypothetical protein